MGSDSEFVEFVVEQIESAGKIKCKQMFGGHTLYCNEKVVALICDNKLFVKPTIAGREFIGDVTEGSAYPGAKPSLLIEDQIEDSEWLSELIAITEKELPEPKPKKKRKQKSS